jgi:hypothetical protein
MIILIIFIFAFLDIIFLCKEETIEIYNYFFDNKVIKIKELYIINILKTFFLYFFIILYYTYSLKYNQLYIDILDVDNDKELFIGGQLITIHTKIKKLED